MNMPDDEQIMREPQHRTPEEWLHAVNTGVRDEFVDQEKRVSIREQVKNREGTLVPPLCLVPRCDMEAMELPRTEAEFVTYRAWCKNHSEKLLSRDAPPETILQEAQRIVYKDRGASYGTPAECHGFTADLMASWLQGRYKGQNVLERMDAYDVCVFNMLQKLSRCAYQLRATGRPHRDSLVDIAGYAGNMEMIDKARHPEDSRGT